MTTDHLTAPHPLGAHRDSDDRVARAFRAAATRPEAFVTLRDEDDVRADVAAALARGGPLAGRLLAVKDNVDVAGLPTTAACPGYAYHPDTDAPAVAALRAAGAVVVGKTNLDQFATGLVGTRSPYGAVRDSRRADRVSGGSSSGSAVAVAIGAADLAIGTDTAGSGRVPAAFQGLVGIKATIGVVSTAGAVPACASYDCVTILAHDLDDAEDAMAVMATGPRAWPADTPFAAPAVPTLAVPERLVAMDDRWTAAFERAVEAARTAGMRIVPIDATDFLAAATLLYGGALVAERADAVGDFAAVADASDGIDPTVGSILASAHRHGAVDLLRDRAEVARLRARALALMDGCDGLLVPTAPMHPTLAEVAADPVGVNSRVGTYTNFCNLFDLCAVAVPAGEVDEEDGTVAQFGVTVLGRSFEDAVVADLARRLTTARRGVPEPERTAASWPERAGAAACGLVVVGAHLRDQPLAGQLHALGARWAGSVRTAAAYRMTALDTVPPKPALLRVEEGGRSLAAERWVLSPAALGVFLSALPAPMALGAVELSDGTYGTGFVCGDEAAAAAPDISAFGGWRAYLAR